LLLGAVLGVGQLSVAVTNTQDKQLKKEGDLF
jgi:hypothetical protein